MGENDNNIVNTIDKEKQLVYLQLLQEPISRMSSTSAIYKGFSAAIIAGLASVSVTEISNWAFLFGVIPILSFFCLDVYYLSMERRLKYRYRQVAEAEIPMDFTIDAKLDRLEKKKAKSGLFRCLASPSIWLFYLPALLCAAGLYVFRFLGLI